MRSAQYFSTFLFLSFVLLGSTVPTIAQQSTTQDKETASNAGSQLCPEAETLRRNLQDLTSAMQSLRRRVAELEKDRLATRLQEQLEHEEQRGEALQLHLYEISEKEQPLLARIEQIDQLLQPESVERTMAGVGSVHPEDLRDEVKKKLMSERIRLQMQLALLRQDRARTTSSLATTDAAIQRLKMKLQEALR